MVIHARLWRTLALRGLCAAVFGLLAIGWPKITLSALMIMFGLYVLADGLAATTLAFRSVGENRLRAAMLLGGLLSVIVGLTACLLPLDSVLLFLILVAVWAIATGCFEIVVAIELRRLLKDEWLIGLDGALSILWGVVILSFPRLVLLTVVWLVGLYAIVYGVLLLILAYRIVSRTKRHRISGLPIGGL